LKSVSIEAENKPRRKRTSPREVSRAKPKVNDEIPQFYDKPIYKSKKYDLL
jgi:hypothetical protein